MFCLIKKAKRFTYDELIHELMGHTNYSYFKTRTAIKELTRILQDKVSKGVAIECDGLFLIDFRITGYINGNEVYYGISDQATELATKLALPRQDMLNLIRKYYSIIKTKVELGYKVNIKAVAYIEPKYDVEGNILVDARISPQLDKPIVADFLVADNTGDFRVATVNKEKIRLHMVLDSKLTAPRRVATTGVTINYYQP